MTGTVLLPGDDRDVLTGLPGLETAAQWLDGAGDTGFVQAMMVSLQRLPAVNLAYGMAGGDHVLVEVARRLRDFVADELGPQALVARAAGGAFLVASRAALSRERWQWLAEALGRAIARPLVVEGERLSLAPRMALLRGRQGETGAALLDRLDQVSGDLQRRSGRRVLWADGSHPARGRSAASLEGDLLGALHRDEITVLFQPQFHVGTGALAGAEALARWEHPSFGRICAETLFAVADRGDHVAQLSRHIGKRALAMAAAWPQTAAQPLRLSLNVTAEDFAVGDFAATLKAALDVSGFPAERLTIEITEQTLITDFEACAAALRELAALGMSVALDDFGTGFSNFRALKALPLDALKLDRSLVSDIEHDARDRAILAAMVAMARALGLKVIAEGVETAGQLKILQDEGCDLFQGFLRSGPIAAEAFGALSEGGVTRDHRLATYGTLAPGRVNHHQLAALAGTWTTGTIRGRLVETGWGAALGFPALVPDAGGEAIAVHLFTSADLPAHWARLDAFEGAEYRRGEVLVETATGSVPAWIYLAA